MTNPSLQTPTKDLLACECCDQIYRRVPLRRGEKAICLRCGDRLYGCGTDSLERSLALNLAGLFLFIIANTALFMHVSLEGQAQSNRVITGVNDLVDFGFAPLAALIFFTTMLAPLLKIVVTLYAVSSAMLGRPFPGVAIAMRAAEVLSTWSMLEVYMLAVIVAVVKLSMMATVNLEMGLYAFVALIVISTAANGALEPEEVWARLEPNR